MLLDKIFLKVHNVEIETCEKDLTLHFTDKNPTANLVFESEICSRGFKPIQCMQMIPYLKGLSNPVR